MCCSTCVSADIKLMNAALRVLRSSRENTVPDPNDVRLLLSATDAHELATEIDRLASRIITQGLEQLKGG